MRLSRQIILPLLAVGGLVAAACGGDDAEPFGATADTSAPSETDVPVATDAPAATDVPADASSGDGSEFCNFVERTQDTNELLEAIGGDPAMLESSMNELRDRVNELRDVAPSEISGDVDVFADGIVMLVEAFEASDYNILDTDLSFLEDEDLDTAMTTASDRIDELSEARCGVSLGTSGSASDADADAADDEQTVDDFDLNEGSIREQLVAQFVAIGFSTAEAECIANNIDPTSPGILGGDESEVLAIFETCDISLSRLAELGG